MATVERRHREAAVRLMQECSTVGYGFDDEDKLRLSLACIAQALADAESKVPSASIAPVTDDRLLASLACHIDHDEPPGLAARQLATELLGLVAGLTSFQVVMLSAHVRELAVKFKPGQPGEGAST